MADSRETDSLHGGNMETTEKSSADNPRLRVVGDEPWVKIEAVAEAVGLSPKTIYRLCNAGIGFPVIPLGGRVRRYVISEVKAFLRGNPDKVAQAAAAHTLRTHKGAKR